MALGSLHVFEKIAGRFKLEADDEIISCHGAAVVDARQTMKKQRSEQRGRMTQAQSAISKSRVINFLKKNGFSHAVADLNSPKRTVFGFRRTFPVHHAAKQKDWDMVILLLYFGADPLCRDSQNRDLSSYLGQEAPAKIHRFLELACSVLLSRSNLWDTIRQDSAIMVSTPGMILSEIRQLKFEGRRFKETLAYFMASNVRAIVVDEVDALTPVPKPGNNSRRFGATEQVVAYIINVVKSRYRNRPIQMIAASATANCQRVSKFLDRLNAWKWNKRRDMARRQTPELIQANATVGRVGASPGKIRGPSKPVVPMPSSITHAVAVVKGNEQGNFFSQDRFKLLVDIVKNLKEKGTVLLFVPEHVKMDAMVLILQKGGIPDVCKYRSEVGLGISTEKALDPSFQRNPRKNPNKRAPPAEQDISPLQALQQGQDFVEHLEQAERRVLVAKAQEGRGIDLPNVRYVVQLQLPEASGEYLHLAGRTGRMGATGTSITLVTEAELEGALPLIGWKIGASFDKWDVERGQIAEGAKVQATFS
ncbi:PRP28 [Symbiodinium microadriaticum]|nr:PRP28 [Symbiodinium microadriaticum]